MTHDEVGQPPLEVPAPPVTLPTDPATTQSSDPAPTAAPADVAVPPVRSTISASLAVVEADPVLRDQLCVSLGDGVSPFSTIEEMAGRLTGAVPVVTVLGPSCSEDAAVDRVAAVVEQFPMVGCILVTEQLTTALLQHALRAGIRDVLAVSGGLQPLIDAIQRVSVTLEHTAAVPSAVTPTDTPPVAPVTSVPPDEPHRGQVVTVFSPKGGSGTTVVATSLAVELARRSSRPVCIVDADLQFGDVSVGLKLTPVHTIVDAVAAAERLDAALLESLLVTHEPTGLRVLPAPLEPAYADQVGAADLTRIIETLRSFCDFVVVDTPSYLNDVVLSVFDVSDSIALVAGLDIPSIKNVKVTLQTLRLLDIPDEKLLMVLNRADSKVKLDVNEVERALQFKAEVQVPSDVCVPQSVNRGEPVVTHSPRSGVARAIVGMADRYAAPVGSRHKRRR